MKSASLLIFSGAGYFFCSCAGSYVPPVSISGGFFGATVTVSEPGFTVPAKVTPTALVSTPTLLVPATEPVAANASVPVTTSSGESTTVPVVVAPVSSPILAIPSK
jgi:hypothetical protein